MADIDQSVTAQKQLIQTTQNTDGSQTIVTSILRSDGSVQTITQSRDSSGGLASSNVTTTSTPSTDLVSQITQTGTDLTSGTTGADSNLITQALAAQDASGGDFRIRLSHLPYANNPYPGILDPLSKTRGLLFPYTPSIQVTQEVDYESMAMTHSNTNYFAYARTPNVTISLTGKFTVQNNVEGQYGMAAIHFLRSVSKMYFGEQDASAGVAGIPPPVLQLNGYGKYMFNQVRVILRSHNYSFDENVNTIPIKIQNDIVRLPALFSLSLSLTVQPTARSMRKEFKLDDFKSGALLANPQNNNGWI